MDGYLVRDGRSPRPEGGGPMTSSKDFDAASINDLRSDLAERVNTPLEDLARALTYEYPGDTTAILAINVLADLSVEIDKARAKLERVGRFLR